MVCTDVIVIRSFGFFFTAIIVIDNFTDQDDTSKLSPCCLRIVMTHISVM